MKLALLVVFSLIVLAAATSSDDPKQLFEDFLVKYQKHYLTQSEKLVRFEIFKANLALIDQYNKLEQGTATYGVTEFADMTPDEFKARYTGFHAPLNFPKAAPLSTVDLPTSIDWRQKGAVTAVKNQGQCGSCWSFSTTGNVEGQWFLAGHPLASLSEQQLVDCDTVDQGCNGGLPSNAYQYIIQAGGVMSEESYSYKAAGGKCQFSSSKVVAKISNWTSISTDEAQIAAYLVAHGPLSIGINAGPMQFYFGGVADPWFCNPKSLDHGVLIVGFGVDGSKPYWIIKNSWGGSWGEQGYYRIVRGKGKCGLNTMVTSALV